MKILNKINYKECGASLVEYALLVALISTVSIAAVSRLGGAASGSLQTAALALDTLDGGTASGAEAREPGTAGLSD